MTKTSYSQGIFLNDVQRDSAYAKIQRGKINAERVLILKSALEVCDSVKVIQTKVIGIQEKQKDSLYKVVDTDKEIIVTLGENIELEVKRGRRRGFWGFIKGIPVGAVLVLILKFI